MENSKLPFIKIKIGVNNYTTLVDSGSEKSLIKEDIIKENQDLFKNKIVKINKINLVSAMKKKLTTIDRVVLVNLNIGDIYLGEASFLIVNNLNMDAIIGYDILKEYGLVLDAKKGCIEVKNAIVNMNNMNNYNMLNMADGSEVDRAKILNYNKVKSIIKGYGSVVMLNNILGNVLEEEQVGNIASEDKQRLFELLQEHIGLMNHEIRFAENYVHKLEVTEDKGFHTKVYPIPYRLKEKVNLEISKMLKDKIIEISKTHYVSPIVIVDKPGKDEIRLCLDARSINELCKPQYEQPQSLDNLLSKVWNKKIFSKLDLKNSFWQIPLHVDSRKYTGFSIEGKIYQFRVVPFGLSTSSAALVRAMQGILSDCDEFSAHYIDDIIIFSENIEEHFSHLKRILEKLNKNGLKLNAKKCEFFKRKVNYLGYVMSEKGVTISDKRLEELKNLPRPKNIRNLRGFLGVLNYYKRFIDNYSEKCTPLLELLKKGIKWKWTKERDQAFMALKENFYKNLMLHHPNFQEKFILRTDASNLAIAGELVQIQNNVEVPICFISRVLRDAEIRYTVAEKEMLALIFAIKKLKFYLVGQKFEIETDNSAITFLKRKEFLNNRLYRWALILQEYNFNIKHKPGKENVTADYFSRKLSTNKVQNKDVMLAIQQFTGSEELGRENFENMQGCEEITNLRNLVENQEDRMYKGYKIVQDLLIKQIGNEELIVLEKEFALQIIRHLHFQYGHIGARKLFLTFRETFFCENDYRIIKDFTRNCETCQVMKEKNFKCKNTPLSIDIKEPAKLVALDYITNLVPGRFGYKHILIMVDAFTRYVRIFPTKHCNTNHVIKSIKLYIEEEGIMKTILTDNATYFVNNRFEQFLQNEGIKFTTCSIRHPQGNLAERYIKEIIKYLRILTNKKHNQWVNHLQEVEDFINEIPNCKTGIPPKVLQRRINPKRIWRNEQFDVEIQDLLELAKRRIDKANKRYQEKVQRKIKKRTIFKINDSVLVKKLRVSDREKGITAKFIELYEGPYLITKIFSNGNTFELKDKDEKIRGKFHISMIYPYIQQQQN